MKKIWLITQREYFSRVKKKSFILMTILLPLLVIGIYGFMFYLMFNTGVVSKKHAIAVLDLNGQFQHKLKSNNLVEYNIVNGSEKANLNRLENGDFNALLVIPPAKDSFSDIDSVQLYTKAQLGVQITSFIEGEIERIITDQRFDALGVSPEQLKLMHADVQLSIDNITDKGNEDGDAAIATTAGMAGGIIIYIFTLIFGVQVMRGVIEEKTNRIVEVIISSVKPFQLMMGKIIGIAMVGLTQFLIWIILCVIAYSLTFNYALKSMDMTPQQFEQVAQQVQANKMSPMNINTNPQMDKAVKAAKLKQQISNLNFPLIIGMFLFFFLSGYLFYAALFAAVGSAVDNDTDTQQFILPITLPMIFGLMLAQASVLNDPFGPMARWLSFIPFTASITMMFRAPFFHSFNLEIAAAMLVMIASFMGAVWFAGRIYRTGILMYGKKATYKELAKWLFYKS